MSAARYADRWLAIPVLAALAIGAAGTARGGPAARLRMSSPALHAFEAATLSVEIWGDGRADVYLALLEPGDGIRYVTPGRELGKRGVPVALVTDWAVHEVTKEGAFRITGLDLPREGEYTWLLVFVPPGAPALASEGWLATASTTFTYRMSEAAPLSASADVRAEYGTRTVAAEAPLGEWMVQAASWSGLDWSATVLAGCGVGWGFSAYTPLLWSWHPPIRRRICTGTVPRFWRHHAAPWVAGWGRRTRICAGGIGGVPFAGRTTISPTVRTPWWNGWGPVRSYNHSPDVYRGYSHRTTRWPFSHGQFSRRWHRSTRSPSAVRTSRTPFHHTPATSGRVGFGPYRPPLPTTSAGPVINTAPTARRPAAVRIRRSR